jgi:hypothetical protein
MCMVCLQFHVPSFSGLLVTTVILKAKEDCCMQTILFYVLQELLA